MGRIIGTIGATLAVVAALATTAAAQGCDEARMSHATVPSVMGEDWFADGDWFEDQNEGDELDEDTLDDWSPTARLSAAITPSTWRAIGTPNGGEVITVD